MDRKEFLRPLDALLGKLERLNEKGEESVSADLVREARRLGVPANRNHHPIDVHSMVLEAEIPYLLIPAGERENGE